MRLMKNYYKQKSPAKVHEESNKLSITLATRLIVVERYNLKYHMKYELVSLIDFIDLIE